MNKKHAHTHAARLNEKSKKKENCVKNGWKSTSQPMTQKKILFIVVYYFIHIALNDRRKDRHFM